jgi:hypothetical protein
MLEALRHSPQSLEQHPWRDAPLPGLRCRLLGHPLEGHAPSDTNLLGGLSGDLPLAQAASAVGAARAALRGLRDALQRYTSRAREGQSHLFAIVLLSTAGQNLPGPVEPPPGLG